MISQKWLELFQQLQQQTHPFISEPELQERLETRLNFLSSQFSNLSQKEDPRHKDWLEHETVASVISELMGRERFSPDELRALFNLLMQVQLSQVALIVINHAQSKIPDDEIALKRGLIFQQMGEQEQALDSLNNACELNPDNHLAFYHRGFCLLLAGNMEQATESFKTCTELAPDFVGGYQNLAGCYYQQSEFELAASQCEAVFQRNQTIPPAYITALSAYMALNDLDNVGIWLERAEAHQIVSPELYRLHGLYSAAKEDHETAVDQFSAYLEIAESSFDVLHFRAKSLAASGQWQPLLDDLDVLLSIDDNDHWCLEHLFLAHYHLQHWSDAELVFQKLTTLSDHYLHHFHQELKVIRSEHAEPITFVTTGV